MLFADVFDRVYSQKDTSGNAKNASDMSLLDRMKLSLKNQFAPALFSAKEMELLLIDEINPDDPSACAQYLNIHQVCDPPDSKWANTETHHIYLQAVMPHYMWLM